MNPRLRTLIRVIAMVACFGILLPSPGSFGAIASNAGFSYTFTANGVSNTVNWANQGLADFYIADGQIGGPASGADALDNGGLFDFCATSGCTSTSSYVATYTGVGTAASSTLYQGATVNNIVAGLNATASIRFSTTSASARLLLQLDNTTASPITRTIRLRSGLGCDSGCYLKYQSTTGSTLANHFSPSSTSYTTSAYWTITSDNTGTVGTGTGADPIVSFAYGTAGSSVAPTTTITNSAGDNLFTTFDPTIPANSTRYLVIVIGLGGISRTTNNLNDAYSGVNSLFTSWNALPSELKSDLTSTQLSQIMNWSIGPSVTSFTSSQTSPTNTTSPIQYSLSMSQSVTGVISADFSNSGSATGCIFTPDTSTGTSFTISVSGCSEGSLRPQLLANTITGLQVGPAADSPASTSIMIDRTAPTIASVTTTNGNYQATSNANMNFTVTFSESVTVLGVPRISLTVGSATRYANFVSLSDSRTATFRYSVTVDYSAIDLDGIAVASALELNSGAISDLASNSISDLTFSAPNTSSVNVYQPPNAPVLESITANNTSLTIYFTPGASNGSVVSNYKYSLNGGADTALSPTDSTSPITISGLTNGTSYSIQIRAVSNLGDGLVSNAASAAPTASATVSIFLTASATTAVKGTNITITASINQAGLVTFLWNEKRIPGCIKKSATTTATCQWKPAVTGQWRIQAILDPTDPTYVDSYSEKLPVFILSRSQNR